MNKIKKNNKIKPAKLTNKVKAIETTLLETNNYLQETLVNINNSLNSYLTQPRKTYGDYSELIDKYNHIIDQLGKKENEVYFPNFEALIDETKKREFKDKLRSIKIELLIETDKLAKKVILK